MTYITNLVHRTLGVTPVAQPVIQAKFAPQGPTLAAAVQASNVAHLAAPVSPGTHTPSRNEIGQPTPRPRMMDTHPEALAQEGQSRVPTHQAVSAEQAQGDLVANQREPVLPPDPLLEIPRLVPLAMQHVPVEEQSREFSSRQQKAAQPGDAFRLMKTAPPAQTAQGFASSPAVHSSGALRSRVMETVERPLIRVHIGRVDVRMVAADTKGPRAAMPTIPAAKPASLDDYLKARQRGTR
jgi:hypothetical protein